MNQSKIKIKTGEKHKKYILKHLRKKQILLHLSTRHLK